MSGLKLGPDNAFYKSVVLTIATSFVYDNGILYLKCKGKDACFFVLAFSVFTIVLTVFADNLSAIDTPSNSWVNCDYFDLTRQDIV